MGRPAHRLMARAWRVCHRLEAPRPGRELTLEGGEAHHVARVLRLRVGETLHVFDGHGLEWAGTLLSCQAESVVLRLERPCDGHPDPALPVELFQAHCRADRLEWLIQKATEIGVSAVRLVPAANADRLRIDAGRLERWRRIALEACKQSGRRRIPTVEALPALPSPPAEILGLLLDGAPGAPALGGILERPHPAGVWIAVGPESGFSTDEERQIRRDGWHPASLGPRTLRTETAGPVALALVLHRWADLGRD